MTNKLEKTANFVLLKTEKFGCLFNFLHDV